MSAYTSSNNVDEHLLGVLRLGITRRDLNVSEVGLAGISGTDLSSCDAGFVARLLPVLTDFLDKCPVLNASVSLSGQIGHAASSVRRCIEKQSRELASESLKRGVAGDKLGRNPHAYIGRLISSILRHVQAGSVEVGTSAANPVCVCLISLLRCLSAVLTIFSGFVSSRGKLIGDCLPAVCRLGVCSEPSVSKAASLCIVALSSLPSHAVSHWLPKGNWVSSLCATYCTLLDTTCSHSRPGSSGLKLAKDEDASAALSIMQVRSGDKIEVHALQRLPGVCVVVDQSTWHVVTLPAHGYWPVHVQVPGSAPASKPSGGQRGGAHGVAMRSSQSCWNIAHALRGILGHISDMVRFAGSAACSPIRHSSAQSKRGGKVSVPIAAIVETASAGLMQAIPTKVKGGASLDSGDGLQLPRGFAQAVASACAGNCAETIHDLCSMQRLLGRIVLLRHAQPLLYALFRSLQTRSAPSHDTTGSTVSLLRAASALHRAGVARHGRDTPGPGLIDAAVQKLVAWVHQLGGGAVHALRAQAKNKQVVPLGTGAARLGGRRGKYAGKKRVRSASGQEEPQRASATGSLSTVRPAVRQGGGGGLEQEAAAATGLICSALLSSCTILHPSTMKQLELVSIAIVGSVVGMSGQVGAVPLATQLASSCCRAQAMRGAMAYSMRKLVASSATIQHAKAAEWISQGERAKPWAPGSTSSREQPTDTLLSSWPALLQSIHSDIVENNRRDQGASASIGGEGGSSMSHHGDQAGKQDAATGSHTLAPVGQASLPKSIPMPSGQPRQATTDVGSTVEAVEAGKGEAPSDVGSAVKGSEPGQGEEEFDFPDIVD